MTSSPVGEQGRALGNDVSADQVAAARQHCDALTNVTIETGDMASLAIADETVDAVVAVQVLEYVAEVDRASARRDPGSRGRRPTTEG
jgi:arsenite methyltransferase